MQLLKNRLASEYRQMSECSSYNKSPIDALISGTITEDDILDALNSDIGYIEPEGDK